MRLLYFAGIACPAWLALSYVKSNWPIVFFALIGWAAFNAILNWLVRFHGRQLAGVYRLPGVRQYIQLVCRLANEQPPISAPGAADQEWLLLQGPEDFAHAVEQAREVVRGQDQAVETLLRHLKQSVLLRQRHRGATSEAPLASVLLIGPEGIGKRFLARVVGRLVFRDAGELVIDLEKLGADAVSSAFGTKGSPGLLTTAVLRQPYHTVVLEHLEAASPAFQQHLQQVLKQGLFTDPGSGRTISFQNCLFALTAARPSPALDLALARSPTWEAWHRQAQQILADELEMDAGLLATITDVVLCPRPSDLVKAEVLTLALRRECKAYNVQLEYVAPEILVQEVEHIRESLGFSLVPDRIAKLLREPLVQAAERQRNRMRLNVEYLSPDERWKGEVRG